MTDRTERDETPDPSEGLRPTWSRSSRRLPRKVVQPLQAFLQTETSSAILLLAATAVALIWANAPFSESYRGLWGTELTIRIGTRALTHDLQGWVSDGLMTVFFLLVGLEIKRELLTGELRDRRRAAMPARRRARGHAGARGDLPRLHRGRPMRPMVSGSRCRPTSSSPSRCSRSPGTRPPG